MDKDQITDVIQTKTGFEILKVENHYQAGLQPMDKVENEIMNRLYMVKMQPQMRDYLGAIARRKLRDGEAGIHRHRRGGRSQRDSGSAAHAGRGAKKKEKKKLPLPKVNGQ